MKREVEAHKRKNDLKLKELQLKLQADSESHFEQRLNLKLMELLAAKEKELSRKYKC